MTVANGASLGAYLRDRRERLDPASLGLAVGRRRTPGLRREEVAQRAGLSATWYTWLEQERGGAPSAAALDRLARALLLTEAEREHLFLLGLGRSAEVHERPAEGVSPRLQRVVDALPASPALVKTAAWDVVAWNRAAAAILTDYGALPPKERNVLRMMFLDPVVRSRQVGWEEVARFVVAVFRADVARVGATARVQPLVDELCARSPDFARIWGEHDVRGHGDGLKLLSHPRLGLLEMEFSAFAVDGRPDLGLVVYNPVRPEDEERIRALVAEQKVALRFEAGRAETVST
ncbi:helix-turn-helix transcriptional regulator [Rubellimicrobium rubrum]|uniref:helix-turn-helix transcriptional regulator n=1 Tax=Rubellimicrobium rubrum TaxID=2585369 RepID=UPI001C3F36D6|nr:helix-turn-helix transcriptional regulator [Rubellimicrobium rubrum]